MSVGEQAHRTRDGRALALYRYGLVVPAAAWLGLELTRSHAGFHPWMLQWALLLAVLELVATEAWGGPGLSVAFAVQVAVAMLYDPVVAALIAFAGAFDPRELRGQLSLLEDLWRRFLALTVVAVGSAVFHALGPGPGAGDGLLRLVPAYAATVTLMYFGFLGAELVARVLESGRPARELLHRMDRVSPYRFPMTFPGLGWFSLPAAWLGQTEGLWAAVMVFGLTAYGRWVCIKAWTLKAELEERTALLDARAQELAVHLDREQRTVEELEELNRLKSQFVAMTSHEVRTPLTTIIGYASTLRRLPAKVETDKRNEFLDIIERQAKRLLNLVERLLTASRLENDKSVTTLSTVRVGELCREVVEGLGTEGDRVRIELPADLPDALTDRRYLSQVIGNLLENALKYSPRDRPCTVAARQDGERLVLWVRDQGIGIPEKELRRIFDRFYQVDRSGTRLARGVGLGLTLVRELVDALGGTIAVDSGVGRGSCFTVTLPLRGPAAGQARRATNGPRTNSPDGAIQPTGPLRTPPIWRGPSNL